ncbi:MAG TPA: hypothetical protein VFG68_18330 [Fimbriiglobus sp.]|nr:hypothetical protein [Fimbriiglobus sp.]
MTATTQAPDLEGRLRAVVPATRLVREWHLRKVLHRLAEDGEPVSVHPGLPVWVGRDRLREMDVLPDPVFAGSESPLLLLTVPGDRFPHDRPEPEVLRHYWRLLFRAAVEAELRKQSEAGLLTPEVARARLAALGPDAEIEARFVLEADHVVPRGADDVTVYVAFVATFAEYARFDPPGLRWVFPSLPDPGPGLVVVAGGVAFDRLLAQTRPDGAADAVRPAGTDADVEAGSDEQARDGSGELLALSRRAAATGNHVRAAILRTRAGGSGWAMIRSGLVPRLADVLGWDERTTRAWGNALGPLLRAASRGTWPRAARALYDLQKIPADLEGGLYTVDPVEWATTFGRRPLRRPLTRARSVILHRHLVAARKHLVRARVPAPDRDRLDALIVGELHRVEDRIRSELGPVVRDVLDEVGLRPTNLPEHVARDKVVAELLDLVCGRGFLRFGDLRDAVSRNQLKMPDLRGPVEMVRGDPLLRADERLAVELDGVYHRGEAYLRLIQRGTAAVFGTSVGRWLSKYVLFPFGGAFLAVEFARYLAYEFGKLTGHVHSLLPRPPDEEPVLEALVGGTAEAIPAPVEAAHHGVVLTPESVAVTVVLGFLFLGLLYWPAFRAAVHAGLSAAWAGLRFAVVTLPLAAWRSPPVRALRDNIVTRFVNRYVGTGLVVGLVTALVFILLGGGPIQTLTGAGVMFGLATLLVNTPFGRQLEDETAEAFADAWRVLRVNLVPGLVAWVVWAFRELAGVVERGLYSVDEWFRFREGQPKPSLALKAVLALVWFPIAYFVRFAFMLLLEPQINPVKHFPVVTVSHKLLLPLIGAVSDATGLAKATATLLIGGIPGIFGFIAWELKENWRLYAANRPRALPRASLGHHGETMRGLLRPGFHSGTVPGLYKKLRAALRRAERTGRPPRAGRLTHGLADVAHAVEDFARRELVPLLRSAGDWDGLTPRVAGVRVGVQTISLGLDVPELGGPPLRLAFDHRDGQIVARVAESGWLGRLTPAQREVLDVALGGFAALGCAGPPVAVERVGPILVWPRWVQFWERANRQPG